jgi:hypothetical protein
MNQLRKTGTIDATLLRNELETALGAAGTPQRWYLNTAQGEAAVFFDSPILPAAVQAVLDAHAPTAAATLDLRAGVAADGLGLLAFEVLFGMENRLRALELPTDVTKTPITRLQYRAALIARWKALNP